MPAVAKPQPSQPQLDPCLALESSGHHVMVLEGFSLIFIIYWQRISLPAHPSHSSPHLPSLSINLVVRLPPGLSLHLAKFLIPGAGRHVVQRAREGGKEGGMQTFPGARQEYKLAPSVLCLSRASRTSPPLPSVEKQMAAWGRWGERGGGLGLSGQGSGGGQKPLLPAVAWEKAVMVLVVCSAAVRERFAESGAGPPKPSRGGHISAILLCPRASEAVDFREDSMYSDPGCSLGLVLPWCKIVHA